MKTHTTPARGPDPVSNQQIIKHTTTPANDNGYITIADTNIAMQSCEQCKRKGREHTAITEICDDCLADSAADTTANREHPYNDKEW